MESCWTEGKKGREREGASPPRPNRQGRGVSAMGVDGSTIYIAGRVIVLDEITGALTTVDPVNSSNTKTQMWTDTA